MATLCLPFRFSQHRTETSEDVMVVVEGVIKDMAVKQMFDLLAHFSST